MIYCYVSPSLHGDGCGGTAAGPKAGQVDGRLSTWRRRLAPGAAGPWIFGSTPSSDKRLTRFYAQATGQLRSRGEKLHWGLRLSLSLPSYLQAGDCCVCCCTCSPSFKPRLHHRRWSIRAQTPRVPAADRTPRGAHSHTPTPTPVYPPPPSSKNRSVRRSSNWRADLGSAASRSSLRTLCTGDDFDRPSNKNQINQKGGAIRALLP